MTVYIIERCRVQLWINQDELFQDKNFPSPKDEDNFYPEITNPDLYIIVREGHRSIIY